MSGPHKRRRILVYVSLLLILFIVYHLNQQSSSSNAYIKTTAVHGISNDSKQQSKQQVPKQDTNNDDKEKGFGEEEEEEEGDDDDTTNNNNNNKKKKKKFPKISEEMIEKANDDIIAQEEMEIPKDIYRNFKHAQGFTKHVEDGQDLLSDSHYDQYPILYNRLRLGKISSNYVKKDEVFQISKNYKFKNPISKLRKLTKLKKEFPTIQPQRNSGQDSKLQAVRSLFIENWNQYFYFSKKFDSFKPLSLDGENDYIGWSITLIDSLDTLFVMGFREEFDMALKYIENMDFYEITRDDVPIFETNIRVLGGLLGAFDLSQEELLLEKAKDVGDILLRSFDTVNNFPIMYYNVRENQLGRKIYPSSTNYLAELGSLTLEFTRLSIITKDMKYFTYVMNLVDGIIDSKDDYLIKGLIPNELDLSGCETIFKEEDIDSLFGGELPKEAKKVILTYNFNDDNELVYCIPSKKIKLTNPLRQVFSMEGKSDSFYEYLLKLYILLNGNIDDKYISFFRNSKDKIKKFLTFHPKLPEKGLIFMNEVTVSKRDKDDNTFDLTQHNRVSHLSCFAGGFFTLTNRVLLDHEDLELGQLLTKSCVKISDKMGLFPESFMVDSCDNLVRCKYDEQERLDYIYKHTHTEQDEDNDDDGDEYIEPDKIDYVINDGGLQYHVKTSSKIPYSPYDTETGKWHTGELMHQPLEFNDLDPRHSLRPELIESLFIQWRITGLELYREQAWDLFEKIGRMTGTEIIKGKETEFVQATVLDITSLEKRYLDELESWWFSETLKYFYLIFQDSKVLSLDEWVFNTEGHPLKKEKYWLSDEEF